MGYMCDICGNTMNSQSSGKTYNNAFVALSPGYWNYIRKNTAKGDQMHYGMMVMMRLNDTTGFSICLECDKMISEHRADELRKLGLERIEYSRESQSNQIAIVAASVWENEMGSWPSCIDAEFKTIRNRIQGD